MWEGREVGRNVKGREEMGRFIKVYRILGPSHHKIDLTRLDIPHSSARIFASEDLPAEDADMLFDPNALFQNEFMAFLHASKGMEGGSAEILHDFKELLCAGKVILSKACESAAKTFATLTGDGRRREVWDGSNISALAMPIPLPRTFAAPPVSSDLELMSDEI